MFIIIEGGEVYTPEYRGRETVLMIDDKIAKVGPIDRKALAALDLPIEVIDADACLVIPGFIDPHEHIIGAGGEQGGSSRAPEVSNAELIQAGITTVVGVLGTDTATRHLTSVLAKCRQLESQGLSAYMYTGEFRLPTPTITDAVMDDLVIVDKVIGVSEIAMADSRSLEPTLEELAHVVSSAMVGGRIAGKAEVTHFHVGPSMEYPCLLHALLDKYDIRAEMLYPTHNERCEALMDDAIRLTRRGAFVDIDTIEGDTGKWIIYYRENGDEPRQLTVSSDAHAQGTTLRLYEQFVSCVRDYRIPVADLLPHFTTNAAEVLKLRTKGRLEIGKDADVLVLDQDTLDLKHVFARGRALLRDGQIIAD